MPQKNIEGGKKIKKTLYKMVSRAAVFVLLLASLFAGVMADKHTAAAAESTVKIFIGDSKTARHHMAIVQGELSDEYSFSVKGHEVKSSTYTSSNPTSFQITAAANGTCKVKAVSEGTGLVTLTVKTTDGQTLTEKVFVSVYKKVTACQAEAVRGTDVYRGASLSAGVENADKKGTLSKGEDVTVIATCGDYYLFRAKSGITYEDDKDTGFAKKKDIKILVEKVSIREKNVSVEKGNSTKLSVTVSPGLATEKAVIWKTGSSKTASINAAGTVSAKAEGTTTVSATAKDGSGKSDSIYLSVYKKVTETSGYLKADADLYAVGKDKVSIGKGKRGIKLTVIGVCGTYYRVKTAENLVSAVYGGLSYVPKTKVAIPVVGVTLNKKKATMQVGKKLPLTATVSPTMADNKKVTWKSSNKKIASVNAKGEVTAKKAGWAVITATSVDGKKSGSCEVTVTETKYGNTQTATSKPTLYIETEGMGSIEWTVSNLEEYNGFILYLNGKKYKNYTCRTRCGATLKELKKLKVNKTYKIKVRTYLKAGSKTTYSNMSDEQTYKAGKININANVVKNKAITVRWGDVEGARSFKVYRAKKKKGKYKLIKSVGKKKKINSYNTGGIYLPTKYRFAKGKLEIHVYLEFVTYYDTGKVDADGEKVYEKQKAAVQSKVLTESYILMFKEGLQNAYQIDVFGGKGDFKEGVNFKTQMFIHEKGKEKYHARQKFIEVLIGGECPNCTKPGNHWYHADSGLKATGYSEYGRATPIIYMPTHEQVRKNDASCGGQRHRETICKFGKLCDIWSE